MIKYNCSNGEKVSAATISKRLSKAYRDKYEGQPHPCCEEYGTPAECSSHIVSKQRCKQLHRAELIWDPINFYPATYKANLRWEQNDTTLLNYSRYMEILREFDEEGYYKRLL